MPDYLVQEEDGVSRIRLEEGDGFLLLEESFDEPDVEGEITSQVYASGGGITVTTRSP
jgi:hypothetical protein